MNQHNKINKKKLFEEYRKQCKKTNQKVNLITNRKWKKQTVIKFLDEDKDLEKMEELSKKGYTVWYEKTKNFDRYAIYGDKQKLLKRVLTKEVEPKSVREALQNIEENKNFREKTSKNRQKETF